MSIITSDKLGQRRGAAVLLEVLRSEGARLMMYGVLLGLSQLWKPENERRIPEDLPILITCGTRDPVGGMTTTVKALIDRYQKNGVSDVSHIFYDGVRHEPMNDFGRDQFYADVVTWLEQHLPQH